MAGKISELPLSATPAGTALIETVASGVNNRTPLSGLPISTAAQAALDAKASLASPTFTGVVTVEQIANGDASISLSGSDLVMVGNSVSITAGGSGTVQVGEAGDTVNIPALTVAANITSTAGDITATDGIVKGSSLGAVNATSILTELLPDDGVAAPIEVTLPAESGTLALERTAQEARDDYVVATTFDSGMAAACAARAIRPLTTDIPDVTFTSGASTNPINGGSGSASQTYAYNTSAVNRGGAYVVNVPVSAENFYQNQVNGQTGEHAQPWWVEFDTYASDIAVRMVSNTIDARIWCWVDGRPISEMAPDQVTNITSGAAFWYRLQFSTNRPRRIRLWLTACDFGGVTVPTGFDIVANPKAEVRRWAFVGDSWGGESGRMKVPYVIPYFLGQMLPHTEMAHCAIGSTGYVATGGISMQFGASARITGLTNFVPNYIVVSGSINDTASGASAIGTAAAAYYAAIASALPSAKIFVVGPQPVGPDYATNVALNANNEAVKTAALAAANVYGFIDLIKGRIIRGSGGVTSSADSVGDGNYSQLIISEADLHPGAAGGMTVAQRIFEGIFRLMEKNDLIRSTAGANESSVTTPTRTGEARTFTNLTNLGTTALDGTDTFRWYQNISNTANSTYLEVVHIGGQWRFRENSTGGASRNVLNMAFGGVEIDFNTAATSLGGMRVSANTNTAGAVTQSIVSAHSNNSGTNVSLAITPTFNQSSTGAATDLLINRTQTGLGSGNQRFIDAQISGVSQFSVSNAGVVSAASFVGSGAALTNLATATTPLAVYAAGTAYSLTASDALVDFGTTDPTITFATAGTYMLMGRAFLKYTGATFAANQTATLHLRRTNNTPADIANATTTATLRIITGISDTVGVMPFPPVIYTATAGDIISIYGAVSATPSAGSVDCTEASIIAIRLS
jgi:hypothetical protein